MKKSRYDTPIVSSIVLLLLLGLVAVSACIAAEFKRTKAKDVKLDGDLCSLPGSPAFRLGILASICVTAAQIVGNFIMCSQFCSRDRDLRTNGRNMRISLLVLSWISFGFAIVILGVATNINHRQNFGDGWLDGECYVVKDGVYIGAAILSLATIVFILGFVFTTKMRCYRRQEEELKIHAQRQGEGIEDAESHKI